MDKHRSELSVSQLFGSGLNILELVARFRVFPAAFVR